MKKLSFLKKIAFATFITALIFACRQELEYVKSENNTENFNYSKDNIVTKKLTRNEFESNSTLITSIVQVNQFLKIRSKNPNSSTSRNIPAVGEHEIYTDVFEEVEYRNAKYYSFFLVGKDIQDYEEKLIIKTIDEQVVDRYLLKYKRLNTYKIDPQSFTLEKLVQKSGDEGENSLLMYIESFDVGCSTYTITTFNCGYSGNHTNGQYCSQGQAHVPFDIVSVTSNCSGGGSNNSPPGQPGHGNPGGNSGYPNGPGGHGGPIGGGTGGSNITPPVITTPTSAPIYDIKGIKTGTIKNPEDVNPLALTPEEIIQINSNDNLRLRIYQFLATKYAYPFHKSAPYDLDWELQNFVKFTLKLFKGYPTISLSEYEHWFINNYTLQYQSNLLNLSDEELDFFLTLNRDLEESPYDEEYVKEANEAFVALTAYADIENMTDAQIQYVINNNCCAGLFLQFATQEKAKLILANYKILRKFYPDWSKAKCLWEASRDTVQLLLDIGGMVPLVGEVCDITNGVIYSMNGEQLNAALSYSAAIPGAGWGATISKVAFRTVHYANRTRTTLKFIKETDNFVKFGYRGQLRKVLGLAKGDPRQAHHIIPWELSHHPAIQKASLSKNAFHMNEALNGIPLGTGVHSGSHHNYTQLVNQRLNDIPSNYTPNQVYNEVLDIISDIRTVINNHPGIPINQLVF